MSEQRKANFYDVSMFPLGGAVLLMSMRARNMVCDANAFKKGVQPLVLPTPIGLHGNDLTIKQTFNMSLEKTKFFKDIRFIFEQIYPTKLAEIINKTDIVFLPSYRDGSRTPNV